MMREVLHITAWYPNALIPHETPFIERHVRALDPFVHSTVWHLDVRQHDRWRLQRSGPEADRTLLLRAPIKYWRIIEWVATLLILWTWFTRDRSRAVDLINFHIAYPNCTHIRLLRRVMRRPFVITEHYSAYRIGFNATTKGADRIRRIFHHGVPVIVVSRSLQGDIIRFAGAPHPRFHVVDNSVDTAIFSPRPDHAPETGRFFAIAGWRTPKRPELLLDALASLRAEGLDARLRMAGDGPKMPAMRERIAALGLGEHVELLGQLDEQAVAEEMRRAHALVHASDHETYSAVCAEALCCGTPVLASRVGGIPEFVSDEIGVLVHENTVEAWSAAWRHAWQPLLAMDRVLIARTMAARAGADVVGRRYHQALLASMRQQEPAA
ncbi:MAG: glycosyltransferase [Flavobacteriales bacterium]|nr:glycosyltransferase [Flavobacteriales bacterium]